MKLALVRHGQAAASSIDPGLSEKGTSDVRRMAGHLVRIAAPARILHSTKSRARETAEILGAVFDVPVEETRGLTPHDPVEDLLADLSHEAEDLLVVSHLPYLDRLLDGLAFPKGGGDRFMMMPGSAIGLERAEVGRGRVSWRIRWFVSPEVLP